MSNKNENTTVPKSKIFSKLNKAIVLIKIKITVYKTSEQRTPVVTSGHGGMDGRLLDPAVDEIMD